MSRGGARLLNSRGRMLLWGPICIATKIAAAHEAGSVAIMQRRGSSPPAEAAITTMPTMVPRNRSCVVAFYVFIIQEFRTAKRRQLHPRRRWCGNPVGSVAPLGGGVLRPERQRPFRPICPRKANIPLSARFSPGTAPSVFQRMSLTGRKKIRGKQPIRLHLHSARYQR
jgi:hypothetical protein